MKPNQKLNLSINPLVIIVILIVIIVGMLALWRPWEGSKTERTITSTGQAEAEGTPDEFLFSPHFQRKGSDTAKLKTELDTFGTKLLEEVIKLGVNKDAVTLNSSSYDQSSTQSIEPSIAPDKPTSSEQGNVTLSVNIKAHTKDVAQKVQNYLATTDAEGQITPTASFSKQTRQKLEDQARDKATKDAREKAERTAKSLGASVGKVVKVKDSSNGAVYPLYGIAEDGSSTTRSSLPITPGKDRVSLSVEVIFELR